jgi:hypothetical protein
LVSAEMPFMITVVYTLSDCKRNKDIVTELRIPQIVIEFINQNIRNCTKCVDRMSFERIYKENILNYQAKLKRSFTRPLK